MLTVCAFVPRMMNSHSTSTTCSASSSRLPSTRGSQMSQGLLLPSFSTDATELVGQINDSLSGSHLSLQVKSPLRRLHPLTSLLELRLLTTPSDTKCPTLSMSRSMLTVLSYSITVRIQYSLSPETSFPLTLR